MSGVVIEWFGIMRHAQAYRSHLGRKEMAQGLEGLSRTGIREATAVADRLAETVLARTAGFEDWTIANLHVVHAPTVPARETAAIVVTAINQHWAALMAPTEGQTEAANVAGLAEVGMTEVARLSPDGPGLSSVELAEWWSELVGGEGPPRMVLSIGHDPQMSRWLHGELAVGRTFTRRLAGRTSLERGEVAMVRRRGRRTELMWVISPAATKAIEELQAKIRSKMETAKVLGAFLTALVFFAAKELAASQPRPSWYPWVAGAGIGLLAFATTAFVVTMFLYDGLLMPVRYWAPMPERERWSARRRWYRLVGTGQDPRRPPSSAATVMFHGMQRVWSALFVPAAVAAGLGTAAIAVAFAKPDGGWWLAVLGTAIGVAVLVALLTLVARPQLGTTD